MLRHTTMEQGAPTAQRAKLLDSVNTELVAEWLSVVKKCTILIYARDRLSRDLAKLMMRDFDRVFVVSDVDKALALIRRHNMNPEKRGIDIILADVGSSTQRLCQAVFDRRFDPRTRSLPLIAVVLVVDNRPDMTRGDQLEACEWRTINDTRHRQVDGILVKPFDGKSVYELIISLLHETIETEQAYQDLKTENAMHYPFFPLHGIELEHGASSVQGDSDEEDYEPSDSPVGIHMKNFLPEEIKTARAILAESQTSDDEDDTDAVDSALDTLPEQGVDGQHRRQRRAAKIQTAESMSPIPTIMSPTRKAAKGIRGSLEYSSGGANRRSTQGNNNPMAKFADTARMFVATGRLLGSNVGLKHVLDIGDARRRPSMYRTPGQSNTTTSRSTTPGAALPSIGGKEQQQQQQQAQGGQPRDNKAARRQSGFAQPLQHGTSTEATVDETGKRFYSSELEPFIRRPKPQITAEVTTVGLDKDFIDTALRVLVARHRATRGQVPNPTPNAVPSSRQLTKSVSLSMASASHSTASGTEASSIVQVRGTLEDVGSLLVRDGANISPLALTYEFRAVFSSSTESKLRMQRGIAHLTPDKVRQKLFNTNPELTEDEARRRLMLVVMFVWMKYRRRTYEFTEAALQQEIEHRKVKAEAKIMGGARSTRGAASGHGRPRRPSRAMATTTGHQDGTRRLSCTGENEVQASARGRSASVPVVRAEWESRADELHGQHHHHQRHHATPQNIKPGFNQKARSGPATGVAVPAGGRSRGGRRPSTGDPLMGKRKGGNGRLPPRGQARQASVSRYIAQDALLQSFDEDDRDDLEQHARSAGAQPSCQGSMRRATLAAPSQVMAVDTATDSGSSSSSSSMSSSDEESVGVGRPSTAPSSHGRGHLNRHHHREHRKGQHHHHDGHRPRKHHGPHHHHHHHHHHRGHGHRGKGLSLEAGDNPHTHVTVAPVTAAVAVAVASAKMKRGVAAAAGAARTTTLTPKQRLQRALFANMETEGGGAGLENVIFSATARQRALHQIRSASAKTLPDVLQDDIVEVEPYRQVHNLAEKKLLYHAHTFHKQASYHKAIRWYNRCLARFPRSIIAWLCKAASLHHSRDFIAAAECCSEVIRILEDDEQDKYFQIALFNRSLAMERLGNDARALADLERLLSVAPKNLSARRNYAMILRRGGNYFMARSEYLRMFAHQEIERRRSMTELDPATAAAAAAAAVATGESGATALPTQSLTTRASKTSAAGSTTSSASSASNSVASGADSSATAAALQQQGLERSTPASSPPGVPLEPDTLNRSLLAARAALHQGSHDEDDSALSARGKEATSAQSDSSGVPPARTPPRALNGASSRKITSHTPFASPPKGAGGDSGPVITDEGAEDNDADNNDNVDVDFDGGVHQQADTGAAEVKQSPLDGTAPHQAAPKQAYYRSQSTSIVKEIESGLLAKGIKGSPGVGPAPVAGEKKRATQLPHGPRGKPVSVSTMSVFENICQRPSSLQQALITVPGERTHDNLVLIAQVLKEFPYTRALSQEKRMVFAQYVEYRPVTIRSSVYFQGRPAASMAFVLSGKVAIKAISASSGQQESVGTVKEGECFGEFDLLLAGQRVSTNDKSDLEAKEITEGNQRALLRRLQSLRVEGMYEGGTVDEHRHTEDAQREENARLVATMRAEVAAERSAIASSASNADSVAVQMSGAHAGPFATAAAMSALDSSEEMKNGKSDDDNNTHDETNDSYHPGSDDDDDDSTPESCNTDSRSPASSSSSESGTYGTRRKRKKKARKDKDGGPDADPMPQWMGKCMHSYEAEQPVQLLVVLHDHFDEFLRELVLCEFQRRYHALLRTGLFEGWSQHVLTRLTRFTRVQHFRQGDALTSQRTKPDQLMFLSKGLCRVYKFADPCEQLRRQLMKLRTELQRLNMKYSFHHTLRSHEGLTDRNRQHPEIHSGQHSHATLPEVKKFELQQQIDHIEQQILVLARELPEEVARERRKEIGVLIEPGVCGEACLYDAANGVSLGSVVADTFVETLSIHKIQLQMFEITEAFISRVKRRATQYPEDMQLYHMLETDVKWQRFRSDLVSTIDTTRWPSKPSLDITAKLVNEEMQEDDQEFRRAKRGAGEK